MEKEKITKKQITDYFRSNIFEAILAYNSWKMISGSRSKGIVSAEMADLYVKVQNYHPEFFISAERAFLFEYVIQILHSFDQRTDSLSLYKVNKESTEKFVLDNSKIIEMFKNVRNKLFAHRDLNITKEEIEKIYKIPSIKDTDDFFKKLIEFYNSLTHDVDKSSTIFDNANNIKNDIENLFMNIQRGEIVRKEEIEIEWMWSKNNKKASDVL